MCLNALVIKSRASVDAPLPRCGKVPDFETDERSHNGILSTLVRRKESDRAAHLWLNDTSDKGVPHMPKIFLAIFSLVTVGEFWPRESESQSRSGILRSQDWSGCGRDQIAQKNGVVS